METIKLKVITQAQYQFLASKDPNDYYDNRTREQLYSLIEKLKDHKKYRTRDESRLHKKFQEVQFGILLPGNRKTTGPLKFKVSLCINGEHVGDVTTGGTLIISDQGSVRGNVIAEEIICKGQITGNVSARRKLTLSSSGTLVGDLVAPAVHIAPGALFQGKCKLGMPQPHAVEIPQERVPLKNRIGQLFKVG